MLKKMIEVENLSKRYALGNFGSGTLSQDLQAWAQSLLSKKDVLNPRDEASQEKRKKSADRYFWTLQNLNFSVDQGDVFGIIGKNGAGKSTLLKILSKITKPTSGTIKVTGRVASLLEVGTGFHPDLSGRENIFLNGAILGMTKQEIRARFDEIVSFSEVERFLDMPVKRYSSGMYIRLGFAIAAHLEPEILIVDEVLAVGDYEFQQKCLGKMKSASANGRTILFVSHSIPAVKQLCNKAILLEKGVQKYVGATSEVLAIYQEKESDPENGFRGQIPEAVPCYYTDWKLEGLNLPDPHTCFSRDICIFSFGFKALRDLKNCEVRFMIKYEHLIILHATSLDSRPNFSLEAGEYRFKFKSEFPIRDVKLEVEFVFLSMGKIVDTWLSTTKLTVLDNFESHVNAGMLKPEISFLIERLNASFVIE
jgi:ABC-type polysaccharide/polyol phosphate transport system ATPase subunit